MFHCNRPNFWSSQRCGRSFDLPPLFFDRRDYTLKNSCQRWIAKQGYFGQVGQKQRKPDQGCCAGSGQKAQVFADVWIRNNLYVPVNMPEERMHVTLLRSFTPLSIIFSITCTRQLWWLRRERKNCVVIFCNLESSSVLTEQRSNQFHPHLHSATCGGIRRYSYSTELNLAQKKVSLKTSRKRALPESAPSWYHRLETNTEVSHCHGRPLVMLILFSSPHFSRGRWYLDLFLHKNIDIHISSRRIICLVLLRDILTAIEVQRARSTCTTCAETRSRLSLRW